MCRIGLENVTTRGKLVCLFSSGDHKLSIRKIKLNGNFVVLIHWINAYNWDMYVNLTRCTIQKSLTFTDLCVH